ncbi:TIGR01212 family radical SAM protein [Candidatus Magnetobacterium casense]|uniref:TIGR01212 family radical SAM protein n=1 Tax=Candidatus Magnetobacterium casense TaxID=1455061 RepID=UPI00058C2EE5|nr:TIGR01212 family radical SAM protein [Candidatus Magnetobacterium casensis]
MQQWSNSFGSYMRQRFGEIVYKVNVDAGFTCPNRDGKVAYGGCIYCNNDSFRPSACQPTVSIKDQVSAGIVYLKRRYKAKRFIVYFQPFTNTYADVAALSVMYYEALAHPDVIGLAIGTRPDTIDEQKVDLLSHISKTHFVLVEYGLQSIYDKSLLYINRGHDYKCFLDTIEITRDRGIAIGAHLIVGLPTETIQEMLDMADEVSSLPVEFLKIHQLQVVKNTRMADIYNENPFYVFSYHDYLDFLVEFVERLAPGIVLQRLFALAPDDILIAPRWHRTRQQIIRDIDSTFRQKNARQGKRYNKTTDCL